MTLPLRPKQLAALAMLGLLYCTLSDFAIAGPVIWVGDAGNMLYTVDLETHQSVQVGQMTASDAITDIAMSPSGQLWGISFNSVWRIDRSTAAATLVGTHGIFGGNALTFDSEGRLFASGGGSNRLFSIDQSTGVATALPGTMGAGSAGDLAFANDALYLADTSGRLVRLILTGAFPYQVSPITVGTFPVASVYGLALASDTTGRLFATAGSNVYLVDTANAALASFASLPPGVVANGATSETAASIVVVDPPAPNVAGSTLALLRNLKPNFSLSENPLLQCIQAGASRVAGRRRNLVLLVHGWNSDPSAWALGLRDQIANVISTNDTTRSEAWDLCALDWSVLGEMGSGSHTLLPSTAFGNAEQVAKTVWPSLRGQYHYVHLIGHSVGSHVIDLLAHDFKSPDQGTAAIVHETFLDAYDAGTGISYGCKADWAESYVDNRLPDIWGFLTNTNLTLPCAFNIDVTDVDPVYSALPITITNDALELEQTRVHAWPYHLYRYTAGLTDSITADLDPLEAWSFGFGLSKASGRRITTNPNQWVPLVPDRDANGFPEVPSHAVPGLGRNSGICLARINESSAYRTRTVDCLSKLPLAFTTSPPPSSNNIPFVELQPTQTNDWLGSAAQSTPSTTGRTTLNLPSPAVVRLANQSPVWITFTARLSETIDALQFDYQFTPGNSGNGLLSAFVDNRLVYRITQALSASPSNSSGLLSVGRLDPGFHSLAFRLDMLTDVPSEVTISSLEIGRMTLRSSDNIAPIASITAPRHARLGTSVELDGSASHDPDPNSTALTYRWTQISGPAVDLSDSTVTKPTFQATQAGDYRLQLVVKDILSPSEAAVVTVTVPILGDVDLDGDVDRDDISSIRAAIGTPVENPSDIRDVNGDQALSEADVTEARNRCTIANCGDSSSSRGGGGAFTVMEILGLLMLSAYLSARRCLVPRGSFRKLEKQ